MHTNTQQRGAQTSIALHPRTLIQFALAAPAFAGLRMVRAAARRFM